MSESPSCATLKGEVRQLLDRQLDYLWKERQVLCVTYSCAMVQPKLRRALGKYGVAETGLIARRLRRHEQCRSANAEDIQALAHALTALSFNFGFISAAILRQNRSHTRSLARRAADLLSRAVLAE